MDPMNITIRRSRPEDARALGRLAQLDETLTDEGPYLVAEVGGEMWAALPVPGGPGFADPFRRSAPALGMLELRRAQLETAAGAPRVSFARRAARRLRRYRAPASA